MALAANILVAILESFSLWKVLRKRKWQMLCYYTQFSNIITLFSCLAFLICGGMAAPLRYLSTCMMVMTFLITLCVLVPMGGGFKKLMLSGNGLYHHTICPIVSVSSYILREQHDGLWSVPVILTFIYGIVMLILNGKEIFDGPYPFFRVKHQSMTATVLWIAALIAVIYGISIGVMWVAG